MKKLLSVCSVIVLSPFLLAAGDSTWNGWISDSHCGAKGVSTAHAGCAKKCIEGGAKPVLVTDGEGKVLQIANPDAVKGHEGAHVKVKGTAGSDGAVHIDKIEAM